MKINISVQFVCMSMKEEKKGYTQVNFNMKSLLLHDHEYTLCQYKCHDTEGSIRQAALLRKVVYLRVHRLSFSLHHKCILYDLQHFMYCKYSWVKQLPCSQHQYC